MKKYIKSLKDLLAIQGSYGNWNYDPYMMGLYNGLEMARSIAEGDEPVFKNSPKRWMKNIPLRNRIALWWLKITGTGTTNEHK